MGTPNALKKAEIVLTYKLLHTPPAQTDIVFPIIENKKFIITDDIPPYYSSLLSDKGN